MKLKISLIVDYDVPDEVYDEVISASDWKDKVTHMKESFINQLELDGDDIKLKITKFNFEK